MSIIGTQRGIGYLIKAISRTQIGKLNCNFEKYLLVCRSMDMAFFRMLV